MNSIVLRNQLILLAIVLCTSEPHPQWRRGEREKSENRDNPHPILASINHHRHHRIIHHSFTQPPNQQQQSQLQLLQLNNLKINSSHPSVEDLLILSGHPHNATLSPRTLNGTVVRRTYLDGQGRVYRARPPLRRTKNGVKQPDRGQSVEDKRGFVSKTSRNGFLDIQIASGRGGKVSDDDEDLRGENVQEVHGKRWRIAQRVRRMKEDGENEEEGKKKKRGKGKKKKRRREKKKRGKKGKKGERKEWFLGDEERRDWTTEIPKEDEIRMFSKNGTVDLNVLFDYRNGNESKFRYPTIITNSFSPPAPYQQPYSRIKIFNLRLVINIEDNTGCLHCPGDKIIIVKKGAKCAPLLLPPITSCSNQPVKGNRPLRWTMQDRQRGGRILPEGSHTIMLKINYKNLFRTCSFMYHVKVMRCPYPNPVYNGVVECTQERSWGSRCAFRCNPGYYLLGSPVSACEGSNSSVNWTHPFPVCIETNSCLRLHSIENGIITCKSTSNSSIFVSSGGICVYQCNFGYNMSKIDINNSVTSCFHGMWNHTAIPTCSPITCDSPPVPSDGFVNCTRNGSQVDNYFLSGTNCRWGCQDGFVVPTNQLGKENISCVGPEWNGTDVIECRKRMMIFPKPNMCIDQKLTSSNVILPAEFITEDGRLPDVTCSFQGEFDPGIYENICEATDTELRTTITCRYTVEIVAKGCDPPLPIQNSVVRCDGAFTGGISYPVGTICEFECNSGFVIPTTHLEISKIKCGQNLQWNSTKVPTCKEQIPPTLDSCEDIKSFVEDPSKLEIPIPKFFTHLGNDANVTCNITKIHQFGDFINFCIAWDPELRISQTCQYSVNIQDNQCTSLTPPTNGHLTCKMTTEIMYKCTIYCNEGFFFPPQYKHLNQTQCNVEIGDWDLSTSPYLLSHLPDCLGESTSSMQTDLHFNVSTVYDCGNAPSISKVQENIREGLLERNRIICDQIDCTDFSFLCDQLYNGISVLETVWNVTAQFFPVDFDDYSEEDEFLDEDLSESETLLTKIQLETSRIVSSDESFHSQLSDIGATVLKESYRQGNIDVICIEIGYVVDPDTFRCLQCPTGTFYSKSECFPCPLDTYQDETGQITCKPCPVGTVSSGTGTRLKAQCSAVNKNTLDQSHLRDANFYDLCPPNRCKNGGTCFIVGSDDILCFCADGFEGNFCEHRQCPNNFCLNGGTCQFVNEIFQCLCPPGFSGKKCERSKSVVSGRFYHPCASSPCIKGGLCMESEDLSFYYCKCAANRVGDHCEHGICPVPYRRWFCLNEGQCVILDDTHAMVCLCKEGFIGSRCEYLDGEFPDVETSENSEETTEAT